MLMIFSVFPTARYVLGPYALGNICGVSDNAPVKPLPGVCGMKCFGPDGKRRKQWL